MRNNPFKTAATVVAVSALVLLCRYLALQVVIALALYTPVNLFEVMPEDALRISLLFVGVAMAVTVINRYILKPSKVEGEEHEA